MLDIIFITLWLVNRGKAKQARIAGEIEDAVKYAKRAKIFGWLEIANLVLGLCLGLLLVTSG